MSKLDELLKMRDSLYPQQEEEISLPNPNLPDGGGEVETVDDKLNALASLETPEQDAEDLKAQISADVTNKEVSNPYTETKEEKTVKSIADIRKSDDSNTQPKISTKVSEPKTPTKLDELTSIQKQLEALKGTKEGARNKDTLMMLAKGLINAMGHFQAANPNARIGTKAIKQGDMIDDQMFSKRYSQDLGELMDKVKMSQASQKDKELSDYRKRQLDLQEKAIQQRSQESAADRANKLAMTKAKVESKSKGLTKGQEAADKEFGKSFNEYITGGKEKTQANINDLKRALKIMEDNPGIYTGAIDRGVEIIDSPMLRKALNPKAQEVKNLANTVSMQDLKRVLGGQFAEREGKMLMDAAFDPSIGEEESKNALRKLIEKIEIAQRGMDRAVNYFDGEGKGSLVGYKPVSEKSPKGQSTQSPQTTKPQLADNEVRRVDKNGVVSIFDKNTREFIRKEYGKIQ